MSFHRLVLYCVLGLAVVVGLVLLVVPAPYGRHYRRGPARRLGPELEAPFAWWLMESPAALYFAYLFSQSERLGDPVSWAFFLLWEAHYVRRTFVYPAQLAGRGRPMPLVVALLGFAFNVANAYLQAGWLFTIGPVRPPAWLADPRFLLGTSLFVLGYAAHVHADRVLARLRRPGESRYRVPRGGLYQFVSCPNYFGEIVEWTGWAVLTWSAAGAAFALFTLANLGPRALAHHRWYLRAFPSYPRERRALIPFVL